MIVLPLDELMDALADERDREARQIALRATGASRDRRLRRRLGGALIRLGLWLDDAPLGASLEAEAKSLPGSLR